MIERIKTFSLWFLILLSVFLTYQIWTFQPDYALLENTEYIEHTQIGEEKKLDQIIKPKQIILHVDQRHYSPVNYIEFYDQLVEEFKGVALENFFPTSNFNSGILEGTNGIELLFPESIPLDGLKEIFQISSKEQYYIDEVDRIILYLNEEETQVIGKLISYDENITVTIKTSLLPSKLSDQLVIIDEDNYEVFSHDLAGYINGFKKTVYLPKDSLELDGVTFFSKAISTEYFKQSLFSDPNYVKHYRQSNGEEAFTDGNRMVNVINNGNVLSYINPTFGDTLDRNNKHFLYSSVDFLNGHGGLTNSFFYDRLKKVGTNEEITFRLYIGGIPVYGSNIYRDSSLYKITLNRVGANHIEQYTRPLFLIEEDPVNITKSIKISSGAKVIEAINEMEDFNPFLLTDIDKGYIMIKRQSFIMFEPRWFIQYNGRWEVLNITGETDAVDSEANASGLE